MVWLLVLFSFLGWWWRFGNNIWRDHNDEIDAHENDNNASFDEKGDHEDNYSSGGDIWDAGDVFQRSRESEWFFFHPLDGFPVMMIRIMIIFVMIAIIVMEKGWWMDQK